MSHSDHSVSEDARCITHAVSVVFQLGPMRTVKYRFFRKTSYTF